MNRDIVFLDLFSGIGGFSKGLSEAGFNIIQHYYSEIDKHTIAVYKYQFKNSIYAGSITTLDGRTITRPDIITFGSPCQDFSLAGQRKGLKGSKSSLIEHAIRLVSECRPDFFIWENVKGAFSSNDSRDFWTIIKAFADIGSYRLEWQLLNTSWFLPQNRERIYLVGSLTGIGRNIKDIFPVTESNILSKQMRGERQRTGEVSTTITSNSQKGVHNQGETYIQVIHKTSGQTVTQKTEETGTLQAGGANVMDKVPNVVVGTFRTHKDGQGFREVQSDNCPAIPARERSDGSGQPVIRICDSGLHRQPQERNIAPPLRANTGAGHGNYITKSKKTNQFYKDLIRRLIEIECERLQGFPDNWTQYGDYNGEIKKVPMTQRYKMIGNAVTVAVVKEIGMRLLK